MDAVLQHPVTTMTVEPNLRLHAVPCKKRPLSWYKPPACPRNLLAISPSTSGRDHPVNLGSDGSPINLTHSVSHVSQGLSVSPTILSHPVSAVTLGYPRCPISPSHSASPAHSPARSPTPTHTVGPASPASSSSSHEDSLQGPLQVQGQLTAPAPAPALWPCALVARDAKSSALGTPTSFPSSLRPPVARKQSDFSIEHILRGAGTPRSPPPSSPVHQPDGHFEWLQCTRYRPPKLPRSRRRDGPAQRRLGRNPRIPFSPQQVAVLEARFSRSHYLSSADVAELSAQLELSETRVKIWFQNRRARERRDGDGRSTTSPPHNLTVTAKLAKPPTPSHLPRSTTSAFSVPKSQPIQNAVESIIGSQKI